jgi:membrane protein implicated in regulation of membrane protease activity
MRRPPRDAILTSHSALVALVALAMFLLDVRTPNGLLDGFLYVFPVLMCCRIPDARAAPLLALALMPALFFGYWVSPMGSPAWIAVTNRVVAAAMIWLLALFVREFVSSRMHRTLDLSQREQQLRDRRGISRWLRDDVDLELQVMDWRLNRLQRCADSPDLRTESLILRRAIARAREAVLSEAARLGD